MLKTVLVKADARWLGSPLRVFHQFLVSSLSYLTLPFARNKQDAIKEFFTNHYYHTNDPLVFDGQSESYFDILLMRDFDNPFHKKNILDIGCGRGSFFSWARNRQIPFQSYTGVDVAFMNSTLDKNAKIINLDVIELKRIPINKPHIAVLINSMCYLDDTRLSSILEDERIKELLIIDPIPSIFWDAHFRNIILNYRDYKAFASDIELYNFTLTTLIIDYGLSCGKHYLFPLRWCGHFIRG